MLCEIASNGAVAVALLGAEVINLVVNRCRFGCLERILSFLSRMLNLIQFIIHRHASWAQSTCELLCRLA